MSIVRRIFGLIITIIASIFSYHFWSEMTSNTYSGAATLTLAPAVQGLLDAFYFAYAMMFVLLGILIVLM